MKKDGTKVIYKGLFLTEESEDRMRRRSSEDGGLLSVEVEDLHITFKFMPSEGFPEELEEVEYEIEVIAYGNDGNVQGYEVILPAELEMVYQGAGVPHITVSKEEEAKAKQTAFLDFEVREHFRVCGYLGYYLGSGKVVYE